MHTYNTVSKQTNDYLKFFLTVCISRVQAVEGKVPKHIPWKKPPSSGKVGYCKFDLRFFSVASLSKSDIATKAEK